MNLTHGTLLSGSRALLALCCAAGIAGAALASPPARHAAAAARKAAPPAPRDGEAEARLIEIYRLIGRADTRGALQRAEALVKDHPNFGLAQRRYSPR